MNTPSRYQLQISCAAAILALSGPAISEQPSARKAAAVQPPILAVHTGTMTGKVTAVHNTRRMVQVETDSGKAMSLLVGPEVKNFNNVKVGDRVTTRYTEALAMALAEVPGNTDDLGSIRTKVETQAAAQAQGNKPGVGVAEQTTMIANVFDVDRQRGTVTLRGTNGTPVEIRVTDPQALREIDKNDKVLMSYVEAAAVSIQSASDSQRSPR